MENGIIFRKEGLFNYCGWPTVTKDKQGILYAAFSGNRIGHVCPFGKSLMVKSCDEGKSWSYPEIVNDTVLDDRDTGILVTEDGTKYLSFFCHPASFYINGYSEIIRTVAPKMRPLADGVLRVWETMDENLLKGGAYLKNLETGEVFKSPVSAPHGPIQLKNGKLLWVGKEFHSGFLNKASIYAVTFDGKNFEVLSEIKMPVALNLVHEPHSIELKDGSILAAFRVHYETGSGFSGMTVYFSKSQDNGKTWSTPYSSGFNGSPPHFLRHSSGAIILSYARRELPYYECARVSFDEGNTWSDEIILSYSKHNDIGYPSTVELSDGSLLTVYYQRYENDENTSVLGTKWSIKDGKDS